MNKIEAIINRFPKFYNTDDTSQLYNLLKSFSDEFDITYNDFIKRADDSIGIDTVMNEDLDWRFGTLLNTPRQNGESDSTYKKRLLAVINSLQGGTAFAIHYAVSIMLGLTDDEEKAERCIKIYDGWEYENADIDMKYPGHFICTFKLDKEDRDIYYTGIEDDIISALKDIKAAGTIAHVIVEFTRYNDLSLFTHNYLSSFTHQQIREWGV